MGSSAFQITWITRIRLHLRSTSTLLLHMFNATRVRCEQVTIGLSLACARAFGISALREDARSQPGFAVVVHVHARSYRGYVTESADLCSIAGFAGLAWPRSRRAHLDCKDLQMCSSSWFLPWRLKNESLGILGLDCKSF